MQLDVQRGKTPRGRAILRQYLCEKPRTYLRYALHFSLDLDEK